MPSAVDLAKRELVKLLKELAAKYSITFAFTLTRESSDEDVIKAFRRVSSKVHPKPNNQQDENPTPSKVRNKRIGGNTGPAVGAVSAKKQRELSKAIKRARFLALMPYVVG